MRPTQMRSDQATSDPRTWGGNVPSSYESAVNSASSGKYVAARFVIFCMPDSWNNGGRANGKFSISQWLVNRQLGGQRRTIPCYRFRQLGGQRRREDLPLWPGLYPMGSLRARARYGVGRGAIVCWGVLRGAAGVRFVVARCHLLSWMPQVPCCCSSHACRTQPWAAACWCIRVIRRFHIFHDIRR